MSAQVPSDQLATPKTDAVVIQGFECDAAAHVVHADFARDQERRIAELETALWTLYPGLVLDLRYADDDDDKDAMRSRIETVTMVLRENQP